MIGVLVMMAMHLAKKKVQRKVAGVGRPGIPNLGLEHTW
jgi:hypothetical protein